MDLDKLLTAMEVELEPFAVCDVRHGWRIGMPPAGHVSMHFNVVGNGRLSTPGGVVADFGPETLIVVPPSVRHRIELPSGGGDELDAAADCSLPVHGLKRLTAGEGTPGVLMVCGTVKVSYAGGFGLFDGLREPLLVHFEDDRVHQAFHAMLREQAQPGPGTTIMLRALMMQCLVAMFRQLSRGGDSPLPWLVALEDPRLARALDLMLTEPEGAHTLESLASAAGMSRSSFAEHFTRAFGRPAMDVLRELRLKKAASLLRRGDRPIKAIAEAVGFSSRSHFSRAFRTAYGIDPAGFRRREA